MEQVNEFIQHPVFSYIGALTLFIGIVGAVYRIACFFLDVSPIVIRFGLALRNRDIAVFANVERYASLSATITGSKIFKAQNVFPVQPENIDAAKSRSIFLVDWESFGEKIEEIFRARRSDQVPIVIYAKPGVIDRDVMNDVSNRANTVVVNARGRLLNDLVTSLVTTSYDNK